MVRCSTLGLTAIATGASCSLAWYAASTSASATAVNYSLATLATDATPTAANTVYIRVEIADDEAGTVALSTSDAYTYGYLNSSVVEGKISSNKYDVKIYGAASLSVHFYNDEECTSEITGTDDRFKSLNNKEATVQIGAGTRTSVAAYNETYNTADCKKYAHHWGNASEDKLTWYNNGGSPAYTTVTLTIDADEDGTVANCATLSAYKVFYRVWGNTTNTTSSTKTAVLDNSTVNGTLTSTIGAWGDPS